MSPSFAKAGSTSNIALEGGAFVPPGIVDLLMTGLKYHQMGRLAEAEAVYYQVLTVCPRHPDALHLMGVIAHQRGRYNVAVDLIRQAIRQNGHSAAYLCSLGSALREQGKLAEAITSYLEAVRMKPDFVEAQYNLGNALHAEGRLEESINAYRQAVRRKSDYVEARYNLGNALYAHGNLNEAVTAFRELTRVKPDFADAHYNLGTALTALGKLDEAVTEFRHAIRVKPDMADAHYNLGNTLKTQGRLDEAIAAFREAIRLKPDYAEAQNNLGNALKDRGKLVEAIAAYREAIRFGPAIAEVQNNLGNVLKDQGNLDEAIAAYRQAICIRSGYAQAYSNLLLCLNYDDRVSEAQLLQEHRAWNERYAKGASSPAAYANTCEPDRTLRIGYVSPDFREHSVASFLEPLLKNHDREAVEVFCYAEVSRPDGITGRLKAFGGHWLVTVGLSDDDLVARIRADRIDILVDLAGHTANNRLAVFAHKPAPVQVTWLGYPNTTGLMAIDYRLVDAVTDPSGEADDWATEHLIRLDGGFLCYAGQEDAPNPGPPPCLTNDLLTFGSFNHPAKLSPATLDCWGRLLGRLPQSRLLLKGKPFMDAATRALFLSRMSERGVAADRLEVLAWLPSRTAHLDLYNRVDISLDPFPYNGTTTTCETLWMGVPVVTLRGEHHRGRVGASLLTQAGLTDWIAGSIEEYLQIAARLARHPDHLRDLRRTLRPRVAASSLCDGDTFARKMEAAYRTMWQRWCARSNNAPG